MATVVVVDIAAVAVAGIVAAEGGIVAAESGIVAVAVEIDTVGTAVEEVVGTAVVEIAGQWPLVPALTAVGYTAENR